MLHLIRFSCFTIKLCLIGLSCLSDWCVSLPFFSVIESHPDNALEDLRLDQPFDEFKDHVQSYDLDSMEKKVFVFDDSSFACVSF